MIEILSEDFLPYGLTVFIASNDKIHIFINR